MSPEDLHAWARAYASGGWPVHPVLVEYEPDKGKHRKQPLTEHGHKDATTDLDEVDRWWGPTGLYRGAGIAVPTGSRSGLFVVDVDDVSAIPGLNEHWGVHTLSTLTSSTASGGMHVYYAWREGLTNTQGASGLMRGVDTRGEGGWVVVAPSASTNGAVYEWHQYPHEIAQCPDAIAQWFAAKAAGDLHSKTDLHHGGGDDWSACDKWGRSVLERELGRLYAEAEPGTNNQPLFDHACKIFEAVKGGHIPEALAREQLEKAVDRIDHDWRDAGPTLDSAWARVGERHPEERSGPHQSNGGLITAVSSVEPGGLLEEEDLDDIEAPGVVLPGFLPEGLTMIHGTFETGKSTLAVDWAKTASVMGLNVIYAVGEDVPGLVTRLKSWDHSHPKVNRTGKVRVAHGPSFPLLLDPASMAKFQANIQATDTKVSIIDTYSMSFAGSEKDDQETKAAVRALKVITDDLGCAVVLLHHEPVTFDGKPAARSRGHGHLENECDCIWQAQKPELGSPWPRYKLICRRHKQGDWRGREQEYELSSMGGPGQVVVSPSATHLLGLDPQEGGWKW